MESKTNIQKLNDNIAVDLLERMKHLSADDRFTILEEFGCFIFDTTTDEDILLVPDWDKVNEG